MIEVWKPIPGFESCGFVSSLGRIRSASGKDRKTSVATNGYERVGLHGGKVTVLVHRLVAQAFCDGHSDELSVNHKDGNKLNNCFDNLEWATHSENIKHAFRTGLKTANKTNMIIPDEVFAQLVDRIKSGERQSAIAAEFNVSRAAVCKRLKEWKGVAA
jgi:hypothetical protein